MSLQNKRDINGIFLLNKALNISSNTALQQVKRLYCAKKAGHTGSLDPLATGILPLCFGEATKFSQYLLDADKIYTVWGRLGCTTITGDAEGEIIAIENAPVITQIQFEEALKAFLGNIEQVPPMYSALKKDGVPLYKLARQGQEIERKARNITIMDIHLKKYAYPDFEITVCCSKGTYIRTLVEDIGKFLHSGAYLLNLRRDKAGPFSIDKSFTIEELTTYSTEKNPEFLDALLLPPDIAVSHLSALHLSEQHTTMIQQGKEIHLDAIIDKDTEKLVRLYHADNHTFLGLGNITQNGKLCAHRLMRCIR